MNACESTALQIALYLDDELRNGDLERFETHLSVCGACRAKVDSERAFLESLRSDAEPYRAPDALRARVEGILAGAGESRGAPDALRDRVESVVGIGRPRASRSQILLAAAAAVFIAVVAIGFVTLGGERSRNAQPSEFARLAVDVHTRHARGQLPLEIATDSAATVSSWFVGKVPFGLKLPNYQEESGQDRLYKIEGARLVGFRGDYAAFVAYEMGARSISLVVTSGVTAQPSGGEEINSRGLKFHFDAIEGLKVITWTDRGLTYALVSDLEERGQQSCVVCHAGTRDRDFIEGLKPAR